MSTARLARIADQIQRELSELIREEVTLNIIEAALIQKEGRLVLA